jgi:hypothetical protein
VSTDEIPPSPWASCTCGHLAIHHEADEHGVREDCTAIVGVDPDDDDLPVFCSCSRFERQERVLPGAGNLGDVSRMLLDGTVAAALGAPVHIPRRPDPGTLGFRVARREGGR